MAMCSSEARGGTLVMHGSVYIWGQLSNLAALTPNFEVPPLPSTHPTLLRMGNLLDTCKEGRQVFRMSARKTSDGKQQKGHRQQAARRCKKTSDGKQPAADAFTAAPSLQKVLSADIGQYTGALVTDDGELYTFGYGKFGGHGLGIRDVAVPTRVRGGLEHERVVLVRLGNSFAAVLTASGRVWTFGSNSIGQLGTGAMRSQVMSPQLLEGHISQFKIVQVSCGGVHTIAMTESGRLFSWGCNNRGQLGHGDTNARSIPTQIEGEVWVDQGKTFAFSEEKVVFISSSTFSNAAVTDKSEIWVWGWKFPLWCGQETINNISSGEELVYPRPMRKVKNMENVVAVACNSSYTIALTTNKSARGEIWVWGRRKHKSDPTYAPVGDGTWNEVLEPTLIGGELVHHSVASVSCGEYHVCALTEEGLVFTWGIGKVAFGFPQNEPVIGSHGHGSEDVLSPKLLTKSDLTPLPPVGRCRPLPLQKALAFAMLSHARLGSNSKARVLVPELVQRIVAASTDAYPPGLSSNILRLMGVGTSY